MNCFELRVAEDEEEEGLRQMALPGRDPIYLHAEPALADAHIAWAEIVDDNGTPAMDVKFTEEGIRRLRDMRDHYVGKKMAILVEGRLLLAPVIQDTLHVEGLLLSTQRLPRHEMERVIRLLMGS